MNKILLPTVAFVTAALVLATEVEAEQSSVVERSIAERIAARTFPSVFQAWSPADNLPDEDPVAVTARHDLMWHGAGWYGLEWDRKPSGLGERLTRASIEKACKRRRALLRLNPNIILLTEIRYRDAWRHFLPEDHKWWMRDEEGNRVRGWAEGGFLRLDFANPEFRAHVARRAKAVVASGAVDGVMLDWWRDDDHRLALAKAVREAIGKKYLIIANANDRIAPRTAPYINGYFMECTRSRAPADWRRIASTLKWAEKNLQPPRTNCVETWYHKSRNDLHLMRAVTTLTLTHSNGYCLFSDPNPLPSPDHRHNWYRFWDKSLGKPTGKGRQQPDGTVTRQFQKGTVIYNPMGNETVTVTFSDLRTSRATGESAKTHVLNSADGDIYLKVKSN
jgi:hypothetical protein